MMERPLMTADELKSLPKGHFVVMKTGFHPMRVKLKLFFKWGIEFDKQPYEVKEMGNRQVMYAEKSDIMNGIMRKYHPDDDKDDVNHLPLNVPPIDGIHFPNQNNSGGDSITKNSRLHPGAKSTGKVGEK